MFNNLSTKSLIIVFTALFIFAALLIFLDSTSEERTFKKNIVDIDTSRVTAISIYPKAANHKEVRLFKENNNWMIQLQNNKFIPADETKVINLLNQLVEIKSTRLAAQDASKQAEYQVDSSGIRVKIFEGNDNTLDIIIGKFSYRQPRDMYSYVRLTGDENIYEVNGFLEFTFNKKADDFRNNTIVNDNFSNWSKLTFTYPDSSFQMVKDTAGYWTVNNIKTDSAKTAEFLRTLSNLTSNNYINFPEKSSLINAGFSLTIETATNSQAGVNLINISGYKNDNDENSNLIIHSSQNPDEYFDGSANNLRQKIFAGKNYFFK